MDQICAGRYWGASKQLDT